MTKLTVTEAKAKTKTLGPAEAAEDKNRRMAIAAARADRAESLAYHLACQDTDGAYLADGGSWDAIGLARLCSAGLASALKAYRTARVTADTWQDIHGALVVAALAKVAEAEAATCAECSAPATWATPGPGPDYLTCGRHRPKVYRTVDLPPREGCGKAYTEARVTEDADGNVTTTEALVTPRVRVPAHSARVHLGRNLWKAPQGPQVAKVNLSWAIERAKGMLADHWSGEATPTPWDAEDAEALAAEAKTERELDAKAAERWASALTWQDIAPHLGAEAPAERMALDLALTDGLERAEAGTKATTYGAKAPMAAEATKKAVQRATKALAARLTPEAIRAAILAALAEAEAPECEAPEAAEYLAPATMRNRPVPKAEAREGLAAILNPKALRSAFLARHLWPAEATTATPGLARHRVILAPAILTEQGRRVLVLTPRYLPNAQATERAEASARLVAEAKAERAKALARAEAKMADPLGWCEAWHARAEWHAKRAASVLAEFGPRSEITRSAESKARMAKAEAERATTCRLTERPRTEAPRWTDTEAAEYLAGLPQGLHLTPKAAEWPKVDTERKARTEALALAAKIEREAEAKATPERDPFPGTDLPEAWRVTGPDGPLVVRPLTKAEATTEAKAKALHAARILALPKTEREAWQVKADAQVKRAKRRAERKAAKASA
jgi:hypothetical protein